MLGRGDTPPAPLLTDDQILNRVTEYLAGQESWIRERYQNRFGNTAPVRRKGDGYECIGPDGNWVPTENPHHHQFSDIQLWREAALCAVAPHTLDCSWAKRGCAPADLDGSGVVDSSDQILFNAKWGASARARPAARLTAAVKARTLTETAF